MNLSSKRPIILGILLLIVAFGLGLLLYVVFFREILPKTVTTNINQGGTRERLPEAGTNVNKKSEEINVNTGLPLAKPSKIAQGGLTEVSGLTDSPVRGLHLNPDGSSLVYYDRNSGKFYRLGENGKTSLLTDKVFYNVSNINWSADSNKAILEYPDESNIFYDFTTNKQVTLPKHWQEFDFSPAGTQIASKSLGQSPENRWLIVSNPDGSRTKQIESLGENEDIVDVNWSPNQQMIATYHKGVSADREEIFFIGLNNENFKSTLVEGRGFQGEWSPEGDSLLYSVYNSDSNYKPTLWLVEASGENIGRGRRQLKLETWADKCTFSGNNLIYCAVPSQLEEGSGIFPEMANSTPDNIYKIDLTSGIKTLLAEPYGNFVVETIVVSRDNKYLYFTDKITGKLFKIQIK